jgi:hypothetical protein
MRERARLGPRPGDRLVVSLPVRTGTSGAAARQRAPDDSLPDSWLPVGVLRAAAPEGRYGLRAITFGLVSSSMPATSFCIRGLAGCVAIVRSAGDCQRLDADAADSADTPVRRCAAGGVDSGAYPAHRARKRLHFVVGIYGDLK